MQSSLGITSVPHFRPCNNSVHHPNLLHPTPRFPILTKFPPTTSLSLESPVYSKHALSRDQEMTTPLWKSSSHTNSMEKGIDMAIFQASWLSLPSQSLFLCSSEGCSTFYNIVSVIPRLMCACMCTDMLTCTLVSVTYTLRHLSDSVPFPSLLCLFWAAPGMHRVQIRRCLKEDLTRALTITEQDESQLPWKCQWYCELGFNSPHSVSPT